jgi:DNA-binding transcriptional regulator LsrR (DeoR family)
MGNIARIQAGEPLTEVVRESPVSMARNELNDAFDRLTTARQASRAATFRQLTGEGMTRKEIASKWGFSQQVVSRVVNHDHGSIKRAQGPEVPA